MFHEYYGYFIQFLNLEIHDLHYYLFYTNIHNYNSIRLRKFFAI